MVVLINASIAGGITGLIPEVEKLEVSSVLEYTYEFSAVHPVEREDGTVLSIEGLDLCNLPGEPRIPRKSAMILLPSDKGIASVEVVSNYGFSLPYRVHIAHGQQPVPLSYSGPIISTEPDPEIYTSNDPYPGIFYKIVSVQHLHGFKILTVNLYPVQWIPKTGEVHYYPKLDIQVTLKPSSVPSDSVGLCRMLPQDIERVRNMVDNPEIIETYSVNSLQSSRSRDSLVDPTENIDYVIITNETLRDAQGEYTFQDLVQSKIDKGLNATVITVEDIEACPAYWWDGEFGDGKYPIHNDTACHIRNFIKDAYKNWETEYILLGGDGDGADVGGESGDDIIPARIIYSEILPDDSPASDLYYSCLDGSFDYNGNGTYGEPGDGLDINDDGEVDLLPEVFLGRAPVDNEEEVSNFVRKTLAYENCEINESLRSVWMVGEYTGWAPPSIEWAGDYKDEIKDGSSIGFITVGVSDLYNVSTLYDRDWVYPPGDWPKSEIIGHINNGTHIINHCGHGNNFKVMKLYEPVRPTGPHTFVECHDITENLTNSQYFFGYSQACFSGSFDNKWPSKWGNGYLEYDCIVEYLVTAEHGAFAFVGNTRSGLVYPWPIPEGPAQRFDREFFDALFGEDIRNLGKANEDSRMDNFPRIGDWGMRFNYLEVTLFGDPEIAIKDPPLRNHDLSVTAIDAPDFIKPGIVTNINATILNHGANNETDIMVNFLINDVFIDNVSIPLLYSLEQVEVSFNWSNDTIGTYEIKIEVEPVPDEDYLRNNNKTKLIYVSSRTPVNACVLDGMATDYYFYIYQRLNEEWPQYGDIPVVVDYYSFNHEGITYDEINAIGPDVLIIDCSMTTTVWPWEFTLEEIDAIIQYTEEGHGLLILWNSWGGNNSRLLPLVGLSEKIETWHKNELDDSIDIFTENLPLFKDIPNPCETETANTVPMDRSWDDNDLGTGAYVAKSFNNSNLSQAIGAIVLNTNNALYLSMTFDEPASDYYKQLLYNAIVFTNDSSVFYALAFGPYDVPEGEPVEFQGYASGGEPPYVSWHWDFGDGNTSELQNPTHNYSEPGLYIATLTVTDSQDNTSNDTATVGIHSSYVWVDDDYNEDTPGWGGPCFANISDGIDWVIENGTVYVFNGTYHENVVVDKTIHLIGENRNNTLIEGNGTGDVVYISADRVNITGFTIQNSGCGTQDSGVKSNSDFTTITENIITNTNNGVYLHGVYLQFSSHNTISGNTIVNNNFGTYITASSYNNISRNIFGDNNYTINIRSGPIAGSQSERNVISGNTIINSNHGIYLYDSDYNTISWNTFGDNNNSISLDGNSHPMLPGGPSQHNIIFGNTITTSNLGIYLEVSRQNTILGNTLIENNNGIRIQRDLDHDYESNDNSIYHNNFIDNTQQAYDPNSKILST